MDEAFELVSWHPMLYPEYTTDAVWEELTEEDVAALMTAYDEKQRDPGSSPRLEALVARIDTLIGSLAPPQAAFVRLSTRSPKDAVLRSPQLAAGIASCLPPVASEDEVDANADTVVYYQAMQEAMKVTDGRGAVALLMDSHRVRTDLGRVVAAREEDEEEEGKKVFVVVRPFVPIHPATEFRAFVRHGSLVALSQYIDVVFFPHLVQDEVQAAVVQQAKELVERMGEAMAACRFPESSVVLDLVLPVAAPDLESRSRPPFVIECNPYTIKTGAALFDWRGDRELLMDAEGFEFRVVEASEQRRMIGFFNPRKEFHLSPYGGADGDGDGEGGVSLDLVAALVSGVVVVGLGFGFWCLYAVSQDMRYWVG